jgi:hypothetical protein
MCAVVVTGSRIDPKIRLWDELQDLLLRQCRRRGRPNVGAGRWQSGGR